jgi:low temperature requirement protein LtrA
MQHIEIAAILIIDALTLAWGWGSKPNDTSRPMVAGIIILISLVGPILQMIRGSTVSQTKPGQLHLSKNLFGK